MGQTTRPRSRLKTSTVVIALVAGFVALVLLFPGSGIDRQPPECYSVFGYVVPCEAWVAWVAAAAVAGVVGFGLRCATAADSGPQPVNDPARVGFGGPLLMSMVAHRVAVAFGSFVIAWLVATFAARLLFGSGNVLVWVIATVVGVGTYLALARREQRAG